MNKNILCKSVIDEEDENLGNDRYARNDKKPKVCAVRCYFESKSKKKKNQKEFEK